MTVTMADPNIQPPKIKKKASKKNKKSWRKNTDIAEVEKFLDEKRFEERVGGSFEERPDSELFVLDTSTKKEQKRNKRKEPKPLKCFSNLLGLPGAKDPVKKRNRTKLPEERMNPIVKDMMEKAAKAGKVKQKVLKAEKVRREAANKKKSEALEKTTRRRTKFDFDLWDEGKKQEVEKDEWVEEETKLHTMKNSGKLVPRASKERFKDKTGTLLPAVEIPHAGASYNPSLGDHQDLLWRATIVEMEKEKELQKIERGTTLMFPDKKNAPTQETYIQEMSEGIKELQKEPLEEEDEEVEKEDEKEEEKDQTNGPKLVTRKKKRDRRLRMFEEVKKKRERSLKMQEQEVMRVKSIHKKLNKDVKLTEEKQEKKKDAEEQKKMTATNLSNYKYEDPDLEIKLSDELTGNLRNLKSEGSLLEDRFKSLQRRNIIETRVPQRIKNKLKKKRYEKKGYKMGWEPKGY